MPVAVVFDLDGTLIDSAPDIHATANRVLAEEGLPEMTLDRVRGFIGRGVPVLVARLLEASGAAADAGREAHMTRRFLGLYESAVGLTTAYPGVPEALDRLAARGHRCAICSNKPEGPSRAILRHLRLDHHFPVIVGGDRLPNRKPDPAPLRLAIAEAGGGPAVLVGDSEVDAETAQAAGVPFLLFSEGYRKGPITALPHKAHFQRFEALPGLVAEFG
jgi:phosphoglycolate phosphatase